MTGATLEISGLHVGYGDILVLRGISMTMALGAITALVGSNGAGKTTLMRAISGLLPAREGRIAFAGQDITSTKPSERVSRGISLVPEGRLIFSDLTVEENLVIGAFVPRARRISEASLAETYALFPRLAERRRQKGGTLSGGEQQMLAIGRALMSRPRLLLLDEPSLGLAPQVVAQVFETVLAICARGITVAIVEQNVRSTLEIAHSAYVLENGHIIIEGSGRSLIADPEVQQAYLGL